MKPPTDQFLYNLAVFELHRHTPGVLQQIASEENPNGVLLKDAFFVVSYGFLPPAILVKSADNVLNTPGQKEETRAVMEHVLETVRKDGGRSLPLQIHSHRGGYIPTITTHMVPANILDYGVGVTHNGDEELRYLTRRPAVNPKKKSLPFILDEIDFYVMDARKSFRPSKEANESSSPKTIYHYVEQKVANASAPNTGALKFFMQL